MPFMPETIDDRTVINQALGRIGSAPIGAIDEDTELAGQVVPVYRTRMAALLGLYEWSFSIKTYKPDQLAETIENDYDAAARKFITGWRYAFRLPGTRLSLPWRVMTDPRAPDDPLREFAIEQDVLYADRKPLWVTVSVNSNPQIWLPGFHQAAIVLLASDYCVPVTHDSKLAEDLRTQGEGTPQEQGRGGLVGKAIGLDQAQARRKAPMWRDPLSDARFG